MPGKLNPYISFKSNAREAMEFYKGVFGGKLTMNTFSEYGMNQKPEDGNKIMHAQLEADNGMTLMAADSPDEASYDSGTNISLSLSGEDEGELRGYYNRLIDGGTVVEPLERAPWGDMFGMLKDRYGVTWMVNIAGPKE